MKIKLLGVIGFGVLVFLVLLYGMTILQSWRPEVPLDKLLVEAPNFPTDWSTGEIEVASVEWETSQDALSFEPNNAFYSQSNLMREWTDGGERAVTPRISQHIYRYNNPLKATQQFWLSRPDVAYRHRWPNFTSSKHDDFEQYPSNWDSKSSLADKENLVCAMGSPKNCQVWYYWARYGQYLLSVEFFAPNQGIDAALFFQIVTQIDAYVGQRLDN